MAARVVIESRDEYDAWVQHRAPQNLGRNEWLGACAKCHGPEGEGDFGPRISNNSLLIQPEGLEELIRNGRNKMPPVARGWSEEQLEALESYLKAVIYEGPQDGG
jgi:mono/diheme cytochrome c family protein